MPPPDPAFPYCLKKPMRTAVRATIFVATLLCRASDLAQLQEFYRSILQSKDDASIPTPESLRTKAMQDSLEALTPGDASALLPLASQCLQPPRPRVQRIGLDLFMGIGLRPNSSALLDPYVDEIGALLQRPDGVTRRNAIFLLVQALPARSAKALPLLKAHMRAAKTDADEAGIIAADLLHYQSWRNDAAGVHETLAFVQTRNAPEIDSRALYALGEFRIATSDALGLVGEGFKNPDPRVRRAAVEAVRNLGIDVRSRFANALQAIAHAPEELPDIRKIAESILAQSGG